MTEGMSTGGKCKGFPVVVVVAGLLLMVLLALLGWLPRRAQQHALDAQVSETSAPPPVNVIRVKLGSSSDKLEVPGTVQAFEQTPVYARTNGYVTARYADIGDHVRQGQLLAVLADPQTDQALRQAQATVVQLRAALAQQQANYHLSDVTYQRWKVLVQEGVVSQQDADTKQAQAQADLANVEAAKANIAAGEANVRSLQEQQSFQRVVAPFAGVILARGIDVGSLISSGSANSVTQMFTIAQAGVVRIFASVPQSDAETLRNGGTATVNFRELPGESYKGTITRTSQSIDLNTRTLLTEVDLKNTGSRILPGMYATVQFDSVRGTPPVLLPANGLVLRSEGPQAMVVDGDNVAHLRKLVLGRDYGTQVEVISGLQAGDTVVLNPGDDVHDGAKVVPQPMK